MVRNFALVLVLCACGGGKKSAPDTTMTTQPTEGSGAAHEHEHGEHHEEMPAEMTKFHDLLAPRWHAAKGPQRMTGTCTVVPEFRSTGDALAKATPPTKANADTWTAGTRALMDSIAGLEAACKAKDGDKFEAAFEKVHESFHALMVAAGVEHKK